MAGPRTIVQLTDTHVVAEGLLFGQIDAAAALRRATELIAQLDPSPVMLLVTGDLAEDGAAESYRSFRELVYSLVERLDIPLLTVPGNHDSRASFAAELRENHSGTAVLYQCRWLGSLRVIGLDTSIPGRPEGELGADQLAWLREQLRVPAAEGTVLAMHHPPIPGPNAVMNAIGLRDREQLATLLAGSDVRHIVAGHHHQATAGMFAGVPVWISHSVASDTDALSPPDLLRARTGGGFSRIDIEPDAVTVTSVPLRADSQIAHEVTLPDLGLG